MNTSYFHKNNGHLINDNYFLPIFTDFQNELQVCHLLMFICCEPPQRYVLLG